MTNRPGARGRAYCSAPGHKCGAGGKLAGVSQQRPGRPRAASAVEVNLGAGAWNALGELGIDIAQVDQLPRERHESVMSPGPRPRERELNLRAQLNSELRRELATPLIAKLGS